MLRSKKNSIKNETKSAILLKHCILYIMSTILFLVLSACLYYYGNTYKIKYQKDFEAFKQNKTAINEKLRSIDGKIKVAERFKTIWDQEVSLRSKSYDGVNNEYINEIVTRLSKSNYLMDLKLTMPETSVYKKSQYDNNITVSVKELKVDFNCISEHSVYNFIDDFKNMFNGFSIIQNVEIKSIKEIDKTFIKNMASGKLDYLMTASVTMYLYYIEK